LCMGHGEPIVVEERIRIGDLLKEISA